MPSGNTSFIPLSNGTWVNWEPATDPKQKAQAVMTVSDEEVKRIAEERKVGCEREARRIAVLPSEREAALADLMEDATVTVPLAPLLALLARVEKLEGENHHLATDVIALAEHCGELADLSDGPCPAEGLCGEYACEQVGCIKLKADADRPALTGPSS